MAKARACWRHRSGTGGSRPDARDRTGRAGITRRAGRRPGPRVLESSLRKVIEPAGSDLLHRPGILPADSVARCMPPGRQAAPSLCTPRRRYRTRYQPPRPSSHPARTRHLSMRHAGGSRGRRPDREVPFLHDLGAEAPGDRPGRYRAADRHCMGEHRPCGNTGRPGTPPTRRRFRRLPPPVRVARQGLVLRAPQVSAS